MNVITKARDWYGKYERPISSLSLLGGFVFDAIVLKQVGAALENFWVLAHIAIIAGLMIVIHAAESSPGDEADPHKLHFWLVNILQFVFGGLLSVFLVFYFRSGDISVSWPFILILTLAFWANESLKRRFVRMTFQVSLFFLSLFLCSIFLVPVIVHQIGDSIFLLSGAVSLVAIIIFLFILKYTHKQKFAQSRDSIFASIAIIFVAMNSMYFTNIIPPIPLSLRDSGLYHTLVVNSAGNYTATYEDRGFLGYFGLNDDAHVSAASTVYAYTAIFSPTDLNTTVIHQWQYYDATARKWVTDSTVKLALIGGREGGFKTFSVFSGLTPGAWRVNVLTESGQVVGRLDFNVVYANPPKPLSTKTL